MTLGVGVGYSRGRGRAYLEPARYLNDSPIDIEGFFFLGPWLGLGLGLGLG